MDMSSLLPANIVCEGYVFTGDCLSMGGGGMCGQGGAWQGVCVAGGPWVAGGHAWQEACVSQGWGHAWHGGMHGRGACMVGGVHGGGMHGREVCVARGCAWQGDMHATHAPNDTMRYGWSMCRHFVLEISYWNAFLFN